MTEEHQQHHEHVAHEHHEQHAAPAHHAEHPAPAKQPEWLVYVVVALVGGLIVGFGVHALITPTPVPTQNTFAATPIPVQSGIGATAAGSKAIAYLNENILAAQGVTAVLNNVTEKNGVYLVSLAIKRGTETLQQAEAYATPDGKLLIIGNALKLDEKIDLAPAQAEIPKSDSPDVKLFVMSFCPYGIQAEQAMSPVVNTLGSAVEVEPHFVLYNDYCSGGRCVEADYCMANGTYCSMHGINELREDVRQLCIWKYAKDKWWNYTDYVDSNCNVGSIETCWLNASTQAGLNSTQISDCLDTEAEALLAPEAALNEANQVQGSPTLLINGVVFNGGRTPESFKTGICGAFNTQPSACSQNVSASAQASAATTGGCG